MATKKNLEMVKAAKEFMLTINKTVLGGDGMENSEVCLGCLWNIMMHRDFPEDLRHTLEEGITPSQMNGIVLSSCVRLLCAYGGVCSIHNDHEGVKLAKELLRPFLKEQNDPELMEVLDGIK